ncbi:phosphoglycerate kinase [Zhengella sp. ZM62]|uniref:phosphoglycerate kinase n=1 Tax=Zhengella sedimenti TaxID=3390035 RepID=UPI0039769B36
MSGPRDLDGATVLVRCDLSQGVSEDCASAIRALAARGARVAVIAGHDDPAGDINPAMSLRHWIVPLREATGMAVHFVPDCVGPVAEAGLAAMPAGAVALMENIRFHRQAQRHSRIFAMRLSVLGDCFVVPGGMPDRPSPWIRELAALLPEPDPAFAASA